jgi:hypothetical protein
MDKHLEKLYIAVVESTRVKYFAVSDGNIESALAEFDHTSPQSIQSALNKALNSYKDKLKRFELGVSLEDD